MLKLVEFTKQQVAFMPVSRTWLKAETDNDIDKPVYIKKWSNCEDKLVFKLNAQIIDSSKSSNDSDENCIKVLQVVNRNGNEIILKYNAGKVNT